MSKFDQLANKILGEEWMNNSEPNNSRLSLADKVEEVMDLVDRGIINSPEEARKEFLGYKIDFSLLDDILRDEFESGSSDRWEELVELGQ